MATIIPITLMGENLGKRHLYLNTLVNEALERNEDFNVIKNMPEKSPIDRIFKIDFASNIKDVDYIIENLKDGDMLYVSRALKSSWLVETKYKYIINPEHLEESLFPEMITTAITKMQHWVHLTLEDESRCHQFYEHYYKKNDFNLAIKFLTKCSTDVIQNEFAKVIHKVNPHYFKIFCQKCSKVVNIFYNILSNDEELKSQYLSKERDYVLAMRHLLKTDTAMILDLTEKYFNMDGLYRFSVPQTKFIMSHHKERFWQKPELYATWFLNLEAVASSLSSENAKKLVIKLAQAKYLTQLHWFDFKFLEPLIKRVKLEERAEFKKKVFVKKDIGDEVEEWLYETPAPPVQEITEYTTIFDDLQHEPYEYENLHKFGTKRKVKKKKGGDMYNVEIVCCESDDCGYSEVKVKTMLDKLFDEFRFASFGKTLYDLRKRIAAESSSQNREFMILVLISKSGGRPENITMLLELLARHKNEPPNVRAAIIRSLVKRAHVWRLPKTSWKQFLEFGQELGLDGKKPVTDCYEGLHAVVIRSLLLTEQCESAILNAFLDQFATLTDYALNAIEKKQIGESLPKLLISAAKNKKHVIDAVTCIDKLIDSLNAYKINVETYPGLIDVVVENARKDILETSFLLNRMFQAKIGRKQLFLYNFELVKSNASYINALRHNTTVLDCEKFVEYYKNREIIKADTFLSKLFLYFSEENGLASKFLCHLKTNKSSKFLGRPLALLLGGQLQSFLTELDTFEDVVSKLLAASIRANAHLTRPLIDIDTFGCQKAGAKLIANRVLKCRSVELDNNIENLLRLKCTTKLALTLSKRTTYETVIFMKIAERRSTLAIKCGLKLIKIYDNDVDPKIWDTIKPIIKELDTSKFDKRHLLKTVTKIDEVPMKIRPEYSTVIYTLFRDSNFYKAMVPLYHVEMLLPDVHEYFIENLLEQFLKVDFNVQKQVKEKTHLKCTCLYIRILVKYLFLSKAENIQKYRLETFGGPFLAKMEEIRNCPEKKEVFPEYLREVIRTLKYSKVFLNIEYVSSLPVMEKIVVWMQNMFSIDEHFKTFALFHLSMIFYKAVRQAVKLVPEVFTDEKRKRKDGVKVVGKLFGKYIAKEVNSLISQYFDSITELYYNSLVIYLENVTCYYISSDWLSSIIKGILEASEGSEYRIGIYLLTEKYYNLRDEDAQEIRKILNYETKYSDLQWFAYNYDY